MGQNHMSSQCYSFSGIWLEVLTKLDSMLSLSPMELLRVIHACASIHVLAYATYIPWRTALMQ